jgi:polysaccharide biosynthesis transport protein
MHTPRRPFASPQNPQEGASLDIAAWIGYLWEKRKIFIWSGIISGVIGGILAFTLPRMYTAKSVVLAEEPEQVMPEPSSSASRDIFAAPEALKAVEGAFKTDSLILRVIKANHLDKTHPAFQAQPGQPPMTDAKLVEIMSKRYDAKMEKASRLVDITVDDEDPKLAATLAQSFVDEYIKSTFESAAKMDSVANEDLTAEAEQFRSKFQHAEQQLQAYREQYKTSSVDVKRDLSVDKLRQLDQQLTTAKAARIKLESELNGITNIETVPVSRLMAIESIASQPDIGQLQKSLSDAQSQFANIKRTVGSKHPAYLAAASEVTSIQNDIARLARNYGRALINSYQAAQASEKKLVDEIAVQDRSAVELSGIAIPFDVLQSEVDTNRAMYDQVLSRMKAMKVMENLERTNIRQVQTPVLPNPNKPDKPKKALVIAIALVGGMGLAFIYVLGLRATDNSYRTAEEAETALQLPLLASVPMIKRKRHDKKSLLIQSTDPASAQAEAFRRLRTTITVLSNEQHRVLIFTSSIPGEGKSLSAANFAITLAQQGFKTLLMEGDLRCPTQSKLFSINRSAKGLGDYLLSGKSQPAEICHDVSVPNLSIIPAGNHHAKPAELLANRDTFGNLLESLSSYDYIIIDTAPVLSVSDTLLLTQFADAIVFVVRSHKTQQKEIDRALQMLTQTGAPIAGFLFNAALDSKHDYYSDYATAYFTSREKVQGSKLKAQFFGASRAKTQ